MGKKRGKRKWTTYWWELSWPGLWYFVYDVLLKPIKGREDAIAAAALGALPGGKMPIAV